MYLEPYLGLSRCQELRQNQKAMLDSLHMAAAKAPNFLPVQIEKMKAQLMKKQWDQAFETAQRCHLTNIHM